MLENYLRDPEESCYDGVDDDGGGGVGDDGGVGNVIDGFIFDKSMVLHFKHLYIQYNLNKMFPWQETGENAKWEPVIDREGIEANKPI